MKTRIKLIRKNLGMNQKEFADFLGVSIQSVQSWETEKRVPSISAVYMMADKANVRREWILNGTGEMYVSSPDPDDEAEMASVMIEETKNPVIMLARSIVMTYNSLDPEDKRNAEKIAAAIIQNINESSSNI